jgi:hypothetical protein
VHGFARTAMPWARKVAGLTQLCIFLSISVSSASPAAAEAFQAGAGCSGHRSLACFAAARPAGHTRSWELSTFVEVVTRVSLRGRVDLSSSV